MPWALPDSDSGRLALAKGYPYAAPEGCYLLLNGETRPLEGGSAEAARFEKRFPVIAHGSNRSPEQLLRKFGRDAEIPVSRGVLADHDVVYSAHMTRYGAIAANLAHAPGVQVSLWITWLTDRQLQRMHETELGSDIYRYGHLEAAAITLESGPYDGIESAGVYLGSYGYLCRDGAPVGLAAVAADGRGHESLHQEDVLAHVRDRHRPGHDLDALLLEAIRDAGARLALIDALRREALPPSAPHFRAV